MNERIKTEVKRQYPKAVIDNEYEGEVQFFPSPEAAENGDDVNLKSAIMLGGRVEILHEW